MNRAAFFDRDGTININTGHLFEPEKLVFIDGTPQLIRRFNEAGYLVIVVTNQAGIAKGYYTEAQMHHLHDVMITGCVRSMRRTSTRFIFARIIRTLPARAIAASRKRGCWSRRFGILTSIPLKVICLGDKPHDIQCGTAMGIQSYEINWGRCAILCCAARRQ